MRLVLVVALAAACGAKSPTPPARPAPPPVAFTPVAPLGSPGDPTASSDHCRDTSDADYAHEQARQAAAIDRALRDQGFVPLGLGPRDGGDDDEDRAPRAAFPAGGHAVRAGDHYELPVAEMRGCGGVPPIVAMTRAHEVFVVQPRLAPHEHRRVVECTNTCRGACGINRPPIVVRAIVPSDAVLAAARAIEVPIDVEVDFDFQDLMKCNIP